MSQADFYILAANNQQARLQFMTRLLEQIQSKGHQILILTDNEDASRALDQQLWDYRPDAFLPHHMAGQTPEAPICISHQIPAIHGYELLINLSAQSLPNSSSFLRIIEIVVQTADVLDATRQRYQQYRDAGFELKRHDMRRL